MARSIYTINKGVNAPIEFRGLKGQYIYYLGGGLAAILVAFVLLYLIGVNTFLCLAIGGISGGVLFRWVYRTSARFGADGMMKQKARRSMPRVIRNDTRQIFFNDAFTRHSSGSSSRA